MNPRPKFPRPRSVTPGVSAVRSVIAAGTLVALTMAGCSLPDSLSGRSSSPAKKPAPAPAQAAPLQARPLEEAAVVGQVREYDALNDLARFLAGLEGGERSSLRRYRNTPEWEAHRKRMELYWNHFEIVRYRHIRYWRETETPDLVGAGLVFYPFSGPDFLFANAFFPYGGRYVMCGLEDAELLPDLQSLSDAEIAQGLNGLSHSLDEILGASYFVTKEMKTELKATRFRGTLPIILLFMARTGHHIVSVQPVGLNESGELYVREGAPVGHDAPGLQIICQTPTGRRKDVYYFQEDLSDDNLRRDRRLFALLDGMGRPVTFVKSASYLMHYDYFSEIREGILKRSVALLQDPSGIPFRLIAPGSWQISLYGNYTGTLDMFKEHYQADLARAYQTRAYPVKPVNFGIGYMNDPTRTSILVARFAVSPSLRAVPVTLR